MIAQIRTLEEIRLIGLEALARDLGPEGMVRFLQQFETGHGDFTAERRQWLGTSDVKTLADEIRRRRTCTPTDAEAEA